MTQSTVLKNCFLIFSAYLFLVGNGLADESYDADEYGPEAPIVWEEPAMATFDHKIHTMDVGLECSDCHDDIFAMESKAESGRETFTMKAMAEGESCGACHNGSDAFDSASQCGSCHYPPAETIIFTEPVKTVVFDHSIHVTQAELSCESCHKEVFSIKQGRVEDQKPIISDDPAEKRQHLTALHKKYCGTCHDGSQAFGYLTRCTVCHIGAKGLVDQTGAETKKDDHNKSNH